MSKANHVALLRAVNVAGRNAVPMANLRTLFNKMGFREPQTLLQSGNVVFGAEGKGPEQLERMLESECAKRLKVHTDVLVRTSAQLEAVIKHNPFRAEAKDNPGLLHVLFLKAKPSAAAVKALQAAIKGPEYLKAWDRQLYIVYPEGSGRSKLTPALIQSKLGARGTARNWNTVQRLRGMLRRRRPSRPMMRLTFLFVPLLTGHSSQGHPAASGRVESARSRSV